MEYEDDTRNNEVGLKLRRGAISMQSERRESEEKRNENIEKDRL